MIRRALPLLLIILLLSGLSRPASAAEPSFPALSGRVVDAAQVIPDDVEARLAGKLAALEKQSGRQLVVVTLPDLQGYEIADYGYRLGRAWGIGDKTRDDGALLIVAPAERKLRIEVGYGLEGVLTDGYSSLIINRTIVPKFKAGDLPGGIEDGVDAIATQITLPPDQAQALAAQAQAGEDDGGVIVFIIVGIFVFILVLILIVRGLSRTARGRAYAGAGGVSVWDTSSSSSDGSSWSSSDSSDSFSGGGGDFGGGGSSGDW
jgi:uncharacterized protein